MSRSTCTSSESSRVVWYLRSAVLTSVADVHGALEKRILETLQNTLGLTATVELVTPAIIPRSEVKAVRVLDERTIGR